MNTQNGDRVAYSPAEFAALFGKEQTWAYRQLYSGKVKAITEHGRTMISVSEVERIVKSAGTYEGVRFKAPQTKKQIQKQVPEMSKVWQSYLAQRRQSGAVKPVPSQAVAEAAGRLPWSGKRPKGSRLAPGVKRRTGRKAAR